MDTAPGKTVRGAVTPEANERRIAALAQVAARKAKNRDRYERSYARKGKR